MLQSDRIRRKQLIREAEGYLDLVMAFDDRWPLELPLRRQLADRALASLDALSSEAGRRSTVLYLQGQAFRVSERYAEAIASLVQSAELDPQNAATFLALGWCYKRTAQLDRAIEALERVVEIDSESDIAHYNLACYWALSGRPTLSIFHLTSALDLNPALRNLVAQEPDFDSVRRHPEFLAVTSVIV